LAEHRNRVGRATRRGDFQLSEPGTVHVDDRGVTTLKPSLAGPHSYLIVDPDRDTAVKAAYRELVEQKVDDK
jgi:hypothetical protein